MHTLVMTPWLSICVLSLLVISRCFTSSVHALVNFNCRKGNYSYTLGSAFQANLNYTLFTQLPTKASVVGFSNFTKGIGDDQIYALFYCRGDIDPQSCHDCVQAAAEKLINVCEFVKEGIIWYEECTLRYANRTIFSLEEEVPSRLYYNSTSDVSDPHLDPYGDIFDSAMDAVIHQAAYSNGTPQGFATKEANLPSSQILRCLAQCTPDILGAPCERCLRAALRQKDTWANTMIFLPSCLLRYDLYGSPSPPPPPPPKHLSVGYIVLIIGASVIIVSSVLLGGLCIRKGHCSFRHFVNSSSNSSGTETIPVKELWTPHGLTRFSYFEVEQMTDRLKERLGEGGYGVVYRGLLRDGSTEVAVKVLSKKDAPTQFKTEMTVFERISHKNLVSLIGYCEERNNLALVYEYMARGDLKTLLSDCAESLNWKQRLKIAIDTAQGLHYLHNDCSPPIIHRDVKPANILLSKNLQAKVADFGFSVIFPDENISTLQTRVIGSQGYVAPEYFFTGLLNERADIYSFGVVLLELITGKSPRIGFDLVKWVSDMVNTGDIEKVLAPRVARDVNKHYETVWRATDLARTCTNIDTEVRPTMWNIVTELVECLEMEIKKDAESSDTGSTSNEITSVVVSDTMTMGPNPR